MTKILVAYASRHESTAEIAEAIGTALRVFPTLTVHVQSVDLVGDITPYDAVVVGSAVYAGQWQASAVNFVKHNEQKLTQRPVWLFSSGPTGEGDPKTLLKGWALPDVLAAAVAQIQPRDIAIFHGKMDVDDMNFLERAMIKMVKAPTGDFRDWDMIRAWANGIAETLTASQPILG